MPESAFAKAEDIAVFDHVTRRLKLMTIHRPDREEYDDAVARIDAMERRLADDMAPVAPAAEDGVAWEANMSPGHFHSMVDASRERILAGDAFQVVVPQRFRKKP